MVLDSSFSRIKYRMVELTVLAFRRVRPRCVFDNTTSEQLTAPTAGLAADETTHRSPYASQVAALPSPGQGCLPQMLPLC